MKRKKKGIEMEGKRREGRLGEGFVMFQQGKARRGEGPARAGLHGLENVETFGGRDTLEKVDGLDDETDSGDGAVVGGDVDGEAPAERKVL